MNGRSGDDIKIQFFAQSENDTSEHILLGSAEVSLNSAGLDFHIASMCYDFLRPRILADLV